MTHNLVESVARAICESKPDRAGFWETTPEPRRKGYRTQARAAVVAVLKGIRVPTLGMCDAGMNSPIPYNTDSPIMGPAFTAMIDALLAQIEGGSDETD
jgi:hypothetical protein